MVSITITRTDNLKPSQVQEIINMFINQADSDTRIKAGGTEYIYVKTSNNEDSLTFKIDQLGNLYVI